MVIHINRKKWELTGIKETGRGIGNLTRKTQKCEWVCFCVSLASPSLAVLAPRQLSSHGRLSFKCVCRVAY